jgi:hypothetical protein
MWITEEVLVRKAAYVFLNIPAHVWTDREYTACIISHNSFMELVVLRAVQFVTNW